MKEDTLEDMVNHLNDDVGLVHQMPFVCDRDGFAATLEKVREAEADQLSSVSVRILDTPTSCI